MTDSIKDSSQNTSKNRPRRRSSPKSNHNTHKTHYPVPIPAALQPVKQDSKNMVIMGLLLLIIMILTSGSVLFLLSHRQTSFEQEMRHSFSLLVQNASKQNQYMYDSLLNFTQQMNHQQMLLEKMTLEINRPAIQSQNSLAQPKSNTKMPLLMSPTVQDDKMPNNQSESRQSIDKNKSDDKNKLMRSITESPYLSNLMANKKISGLLSLPNNKAHSFVLIDGKTFQIGDTITENVKLHDLTDTALLLNYDNHIYLMDVQSYFNG